MGNLTVALRAAQSGLLTTQSAVDAVAKNIANSNTEGYSRKIVNFENRVLAGEGAGVQLSDFTRAVDEGLLKDLRRELSETSKLDTQVSYFTRIQNMFGAPGDNTSISHTMNLLHQAAESLALSPEKTLEQNEFIRYAQEVGLQLQSMTEEIQALRGQADVEIEEAIDQVNSLTQEIADSNDKIIRNQAVTNDVTDLLDNRDQALKELSALVEVTTFPRNNGDLVVFTADGFPLVDRTSNTIVHEAVGNLTTTSTFAGGNLNGIFVGGTGEDDEITNRVTGGELAALISQRDDVLPNLQAQLDELASELRDVVNLIHNRGTPHPGLQSMSGNRKFIDADNQTITLDPTNSAADVTIALFDSAGEQSEMTTLNTILLSGEYGTGTQPDHGAWSITEVAASIEDWLQANGASSASVAIDQTTGKMEVEINDTSLYLAFRDETATTEGSSASDAEIGFDTDGDGDVDETIFGFSNFFKLNDLYTDSSNGNLFDSNQLSNGFGASAATLTFYDTNNGVGSGNEIGTISITASESLDEMAETINDAAIGVTAAVIPDGSGSRLRLIHDDGLEMVITQGASDTLLGSMGLKQSESRSSATLEVREDIQNTPGLVSTALMEFDTTRGRYVVNSGNNSVIQEMAEALTENNTFDSVGGLTNTTRSFEEFSTDILSRQANLADTNKSQLDVQINLTQSLELESDRISGVNLDEEMSNLIIYQQSFSAAARVISVI